MAGAQARGSWNPAGLRSAVQAARQIAQYGPAGKGRIDPRAAGKACLQFTNRLALTLIANPRPRKVKSSEEPP